MRRGVVGERTKRIIGLLRDSNARICKIAMDEGMSPSRVSTINRKFGVRPIRKPATPPAVTREYIAKMLSLHWSA